MMNGQKVVKVFCHEEAAIERFDELNDELFHSADKANAFALVAMPVNAQLGNLSLCALRHHRRPPWPLPDLAVLHWASWPASWC